jgi:hypothetical protein
MKNTPAAFVTELDAKITFTAARCVEKAWWHPHLYVQHMRLIWNDLARTLRRSAKRASHAADADIRAAEIIRRAMSDGLDENDRAELITALEHIDLSARHDQRLASDLKA